jgi:hypothetical protein
MFEMCAHLSGLDEIDGFGRYITVHLETHGILIIACNEAESERSHMLLLSMYSMYNLHCKQTGHLRRIPTHDYASCNPLTM